LNFPATIATPDDVNYRVTSTRFTFNNQTCFIRNQLNSNRLQVIGPNGAVVQDNIGSYNATNGTVNIRGFKASAFEGPAIKVSVVPANESTIRPLRGYILSIDTETSIASGIIDPQNTAVVI
jgi:Flp pilus assembly protein TadG